MNVQQVGVLFQCGHVLILPCKRGAFATNRHDHVMTFALAAYGEYGEDEFAVIEHVLSPGMTVLDVGSNIGTHAVTFASMVGERGRVLAFEPMMCNFHLLCANIAMSGWQNIYPHRSIVGSQDVMRRMIQIDQNQSINYGNTNAKKFAHESNGRGIETQEISIDSLGLKACDLIKIDVEGGELDVLNGAQETIDKFRPTIFAECNVEEDPGPLLEVFDAYDYSTFWVFNRLFRPDNFKGSKDARNGRDRNIIAIKDPQILAKGPKLEPCHAA